MLLRHKIKSGNTQRASGMSAFSKQMKPDKILLIGKSGIPCQEFLKVNPMELFQDLTLRGLDTAKGEKNCYLF